MLHGRGVQPFDLVGHVLPCRYKIKQTVVSGLIPTWWSTCFWVGVGSLKTGLLHVFTFFTRWVRRGNAGVVVQCCVVPLMRVEWCATTVKQTSDAGGQQWVGGNVRGGGQWSGWSGWRDSGVECWVERRQSSWTTGGRPRGVEFDNFDGRFGGRKETQPRAEEDCDQGGK